MLSLKVIDPDIQHFLITATEPSRFEISVVHGKVIMHGYAGDAVDMEQHPDIVFDGTLADEMEDQVVGTQK